MKNIIRFVRQLFTRKPPTYAIAEESVVVSLGHIDPWAGEVIDFSTKAVGEDFTVDRATGTLEVIPGSDLDHRLEERRAAPNKYPGAQISIKYPTD